MLRPHVRVCVCVPMCVCVQTCVFVCVRVSVHACVHAHIMMCVSCGMRGKWFAGVHWNLVGEGKLRSCYLMGFCDFFREWLLGFVSL